MRESNNLVLERVKSESKNINSNSELVNQKIQYNPVKEKSIDTKDKTNTEIQQQKRKYTIENEKIVDSNLFTKKSVNPNVTFDKNKETLNSLANGNEAQFRIIANKFNEAVEVILELSERVKKLEETINNPPKNYLKDKNKNSFFNIKTYAYIVLTILFIIGIFTFPVDLSLIKLIILDIISSI